MLSSVWCPCWWSCDLSVPVRGIMRVAADVFSACALGAILDEQSIAGFDAAVVAGAANNQLATPADGERLLSKGILYAPDYVINAGGIINVATEYLGQIGRASCRERVCQYV